MASKGAKAALLDTSLKRLSRALPKISEAAGVPPVVLPAYDRDPELLTAYRLEALANWAEALVERLQSAQIETVEALEGKIDGAPEEGKGNTEEVRPDAVEGDAEDRAPGARTHIAPLTPGTENAMADAEVEEIRPTDDAVENAPRPDDQALPTHPESKPKPHAPRAAGKGKG